MNVSGHILFQHFPDFTMNYNEGKGIQPIKNQIIKPSSRLFKSNRDQLDEMKHPKSIVHWI